MKELKKQIGIITAGFLISVSIVIMGLKIDKTLGRNNDIGKYQYVNDGQIIDTETGNILFIQLQTVGDTLYLEPKIPEYLKQRR